MDLEEIRRAVCAAAMPAGVHLIVVAVPHYSTDPDIPGRWIPRVGAVQSAACPSPLHRDPFGRAGKVRHVYRLDVHADIEVPEEWLGIAATVLRGLADTTRQEHRLAAAPWN